MILYSAINNFGVSNVCLRGSVVLVSITLFLPKKNYVNMQRSSEKCYKFRLLNVIGISFRKLFRMTVLS